MGKKSSRADGLRKENRLSQTFSSTPVFEKAWLSEAGRGVDLLCHSSLLAKASIPFLPQWILI